MKPFPEDLMFAPGEVGFNDKDASGRPYDLLGRKEVGQKLTDLLDRMEQPLVIALDGGWGSGKSHFLKLWTGAHEKELGGKAKVIYFDAFEHDYLDDPLISLVARLTTKDAEATWGNKAVKAVKKAAYPLAKLSLRLGAAAASAGISEAAGPIADAVVSKANDTSQATIDAFWKQETGRIAAMQQFRQALIALTGPAKGSAADQKIIFIIDELDRCRPDYALTLLEIVKHFFAVPNVHFVLGANLKELQNSVKARYGEGINAVQYLQKFIHIVMSFPKMRDHQGNGPWAPYFDRVCQDMGLGTESCRSLRGNLTVYGSNAQISLRDIQRLTSRMALFPKDFENYHAAFSRLATSALILEVLAPEHYARLRSGRLVINDFLQLFPIQQTDRNLLHTSNILNHLWRRVLMDEPGEETMKFTAGMLGHFSDDLRKADVERMWVDLFDAFHLPPT